MSNYPYIIAGLPDIALNFKSGTFDFTALAEEIKSYCSEKDSRLIDWFVLGTSGESLPMYFYRAVEKTGSRFLSEYFAFDRKLREAKVAFIRKEECDPEFAAIFREKDLIEREKAVDALLWQKADETVTFDIFNMDIILSFLAKARIVERWSRLDQQAGEELFRRLVQEVRGTFKGINNKEI